MPKEKRRHVFFSFNFQPARWLASSQTHTYTLCGTSLLTPTKSPSIWLFAFLFLSACLLPTSFYGSLYVRLVNVDLTHSAAFFHVFWFRIHSISAFIHFAKLRLFFLCVCFCFCGWKFCFCHFPPIFWIFFLSGWGQCCHWPKRHLLFSIFERDVSCVLRWWENVAALKVDLLLSILFFFVYLLPLWFFLSSFWLSLTFLFALFNAILSEWFAQAFCTGFLHPDWCLFLT